MYFDLWCDLVWLLDGLLLVALFIVWFWMMLRFLDECLFWLVGCLSGWWFALFVDVSVWEVWVMGYLVGCYLLCLLIVCFGLIAGFGCGFGCWFAVWGLLDWFDWRLRLLFEFECWLVCVMMWCLDLCFWCYVWFGVGIRREFEYFDILVMSFGFVIWVFCGLLVRLECG